MRSSSTRVIDHLLPAERRATPRLLPANGPTTRASHVRARLAPDVPTIASCTLVLQPSRDWDDIHATLCTASGAEIDLGTRSIYILLYVLAKHAVDEHGANVLDRPADGWLHCDLAARRVGESRKWVNTAVFRLRAALEKHGFTDGAEVVKRDRLGEWMRIGVRRAELLREGP
jgi:hypothetical protein